MKKRLLSTLLALCVTLSLLPAQALAAELDSESAEPLPPVVENEGFEAPGETVTPEEFQPGEESLDKYAELRNVAEPMVLAGIPTSGTCGENLNWRLDDAGTLTISGTGNMENYSNPILTSGYIFNAPWYSIGRTIKTILIGDGVTSIGDSAFYTCDGLTSVTIPSSVTSIGDYAFYGRDGLTNVTIPSSVTSIGDYAFYGCSGLTSINIPSSITSIGDFTFCGCDGLTSVTIPSSITSMGYGTFSYCIGLTSATISSGATRIGDATFLDCSGLTSVTIPSSVTSIGGGALQGCSRLTSVTIPSSVTSIGNAAFYGCSRLTSVTIPSSVTSIEKGAFSYCVGLTSVTISSGVTNIGDYAFRGCDGLTSVTIPSSVTSIGDYAFDDCDRLNDVYYGGDQAQWGAIQIGDYNWYLKNAKIHYNSGAITDWSGINIYIVPMSDFGIPTLSASGIATQYFRLEDENHKPLPGRVLRYQLDGIREETVISDENGIIGIPTPLIDKTTNFTVTFSPGDGTTDFVSQHNFKAVVKELSYTQEWSGQISAGGTVSADLGADSSIGPAKAEANLIKASLGAKAGATLTITDEHNNGVRTLTLKNGTYGDLNVGVKSGIDIDALKALKFKLLSSSGTAKYALQQTNGLKITGYEPTNFDQRIEIGRFLMLSSIGMGTPVSVYLTRLAQFIDSDICNLTSDTASFASSGGISLASFQVGDTEIIKPNILSYDGTGVQKFVHSSDYIDNTESISSSVLTSIGGGTGSAKLTDQSGTEVSFGKYIHGHTYSNSKEVTITCDENKEINKVSYKTYQGDQGNISYTSETSDTYATVSFNGDNAKTAFNGYVQNKGLVVGAWDFLINPQGAIDYLGDSRITANVKETTSVKKGVDIPIPIGASLGIGGQVEIGFTGTDSYTFDNKLGVIYNGKDYLTAESNVPHHQIENEKMSFVDFAVESIAGAWIGLGNSIATTAGNVADGVKNAFSTVKGAISSWFVSVSTIPSTNAQMESYGVMSLMDEYTPETNAAISATIGDAYWVSVYADETCTEEVGSDQLAANPLTLALEYTDEMLYAAGADRDATVMILRFDSDKNLYVCESSGIQDKSSKTVTAQITRSGEYILAVDTAPPIVSDFVQTDASSQPSFTALVSDLTGISSFRFWIDDGPDLVTMDNLKKFYNAATGVFNYQFTSELSEGIHTANFLLVDTLGNACSNPFTFTFEVNGMRGEIVALHVPTETITAGNPFTVTVETTAGSTFTDVGLSYAVDGYQTLAIPMTLSNGVWVAHVTPIAGANQMEFTAIASDQFGNHISYGPATVALDLPVQSGRISILNVSMNQKSMSNQATVAVQNAYDTAQAGKLLVAAYQSDGRMLSLGNVDVNLAANSISAVSVGLPNFSGQATRIAAFLVDANGNYIPQCEAYPERNAS